MNCFLKNLTWKLDPNIPRIFEEAISATYVGVAIVVIPDAIPLKNLPKYNIQTLHAADNIRKAIVNKTEFPNMVPLRPNLSIDHPPRSPIRKEL